MKKQKLIAILMAMTLALTGCSGMTIGSSEENNTNQNQEITIGESEETTPADTTRIPTALEGEGVFVQHWQDWDRESLLPQYFLSTDDTALMLIEQLQNVCASTEQIRLFDGIEHARTTDLLRIALKNTPAIDFPVKMERDENGNLIANTEQYPDHILTRLLQNEQEEGRDLRAFYYQEDVTAVYNHLFGEGRTLNFQDLCPQYYYYAREGVFAHKGEKVQTNVWPMLVRYTDGETAITVDLLLTEGSTPEKPLIYTKQDGSIVELTADNYRRELAGEPIYRYTFKKVSDTQITLEGIRQVGKLNDAGTQIEDAQLLIQEDELNLAAPEKLMVSSGSAQRQVDLQKEYEGDTASEYLLKLLNSAQQVDSRLTSQVLASSNSETLTLTLEYPGEKEMVINVMSQGYLPGIEQSYVTFSADSAQYILPQEDYALMTQCIEASTK